MQCLIDYIGLQGCEPTSPESSRYINRLLPGLTLESIQKIAEPEQVTYKEVWADVQDRAALRFENEVTRALGERFYLKNITESFDLLKFVDADTITVCDAGHGLSGFTIELTPATNNRLVDSALQHIYIEMLRLYCLQTEVQYTVKIFNLETGELLDTLSVTSGASAGWVDINVGKRYYAYRIFVCQVCNVNMPSLSLRNDVINRFIGSVCDNFLFGNDCRAAIRGGYAPNTATVSDADMTFGLDSYGLSGKFSIGCSYNDIVCQNRKTFMLAWAYLLGAELMYERANSSKISRWTTGIDASKAMEKMLDFEARFAKELSTAVVGIFLNPMDCCLEGNDSYQWRESVM